MKYYIVDAFTDKIFSGNPAAVCVMEDWLEDNVMMSIAIENNLSETAFAVRTGDNCYDIRWFTPGGEIDLCGHATLATAYVIFKYYNKSIDKIIFKSMSGELIVDKKDELLEMDFPSIMPEKVEITKDMVDAIGLEPKEAYLARDLMLVFNREDDVLNLKPDFSSLKELPEGLGVIATSKGCNYDFISRAFFPKLNVNEDPVTGSAHSNLIPYWADRLNKDTMVAKQTSKRGGVLYCKQSGDRVYISGKAAVYAEGNIML